VSRSGVGFGFRQTDHRDPQRDEIGDGSEVSISADPAAAASREELTIAEQGSASAAPHAGALQQDRPDSSPIITASEMVTC